MARLDRHALLSALPALSVAALAAWLLAVLLEGRAIPWQASLPWAATYAVAFLLCAVWWWRLLRRTSKVAGSFARWGLAASCGTVPLLLVTASLLGLVYSSEQLNHLLQQGHWRLPFLVGVALLGLAADTLQSSANAWLATPGSAGREAALSVISRRAGPAALACLSGLGLLQAAANVAPIGDDIWHYTEVADALLAGQSYPVLVVNEQLRGAGMGATYPALPFFPILLAISFTLFGRNLVGVAVPTVLATALFPLAMYGATRAITGSRGVAYAATVLLYLFPIYQIHILGSPEPDTLFVTLLLLGALLSVAASGSASLRPWVALGAVMGLATLTRPEGIAYSAVLFLTFLVFHRSRPGYWLSLATLLAVIAPFVLLHHSRTGSPWPSTMGPGMLSWEHLRANLYMLGWPALPWYSQAVGVETEGLVALLVGLAAAAVAGALALLRANPPLVWVPLAGMGNLAASFFTHPLIVASYSPVEFLRHASFGIPFFALSLAYLVEVVRRGVSRLPEGPRRLILLSALVLFSGALYYEAERLARPEWYFEGRASLLWTGGGHLLADVVQHPVPLPLADDPRSGEQIREDLTRPLEPVSLRRINRSEPYHWASLLLALAGLAFALAPGPGASPRGARAPSRAAPAWGSPSTTHGADGSSGP